MDVLRIENLIKNYGKTRVLDGISFSIHSGEIVGFVGKNGAGKTTTMKCITNLIPYDGGSVYIAGNITKYGTSYPRGTVGYLQDVPSFYEYMTAYQYLCLCAELSGIGKNSISSRVSDLLFRVGLENNDNKKISGFSRGMKQRLGLAQAVIDYPKLLICDEPTSALDPNGRKEMLELLKEMAIDTAVLFSTHILSDVERICNRIIILDEGKIKFDSTSDGFKKDYTAKIYELELVNPDNANRFAKFLKESDTEVNILSVDKNIIKLRTTEALSFQKNLWSILSEENITVKRFEEMETKIEDIFLEVTRT